MLDVGCRALFNQNSNVSFYDGKSITRGCKMKNIGRCLGLIVFAIIVTRVDWSGFTSILERSHMRFLYAAIVVSVPLLWIKALRWRLLLSWQGYHIRAWDAFLYYLSSISLGVITPGRIGEFSKIFYLKKAGISTVSQGLSSVFVDRLLDLSILIAVAMCGMLWLGPWPGAKNMALVGFAGAVAILILLFTVGDFKRVVGWAYRLIAKSRTTESFKEGLGQFADGLRTLFQWRLWQAVMLTILAYSLFFYQCFLIAQAFSLPISYFALAVIMAMTNLLTLLPITIAGLGTREAALLFLLGPMGIGLEWILAYSISVFVVSFVITGLMGATAWWIVD